MKNLQFGIHINAGSEKVWETFTVIEEGSYAESTWQQGGTIQFLFPGGAGLYSVIEKKVPNQLMLSRHLGIVVNKQEQWPMHARQNRTT